MVKRVADISDDQPVHLFFLLKPDCVCRRLDEVLGGELAKLFAIKEIYWAELSFFDLLEFYRLESRPPCKDLWFSFSAASTYTLTPSPGPIGRSRVLIIECHASARDFLKACQLKDSLRGRYTPRIMRALRFYRYRGLVHCPSEVGEAARQMELLSRKRIT